MNPPSDRRSPSMAVSLAPLLLFLCGCCFLALKACSGLWLLAALLSRLARCLTEHRARRAGPRGSSCLWPVLWTLDHISLLPAGPHLLALLFRRAARAGAAGRRCLCAPAPRSFLEELPGRLRFYHEVASGPPAGGLSLHPRVCCHHPFPRFLYLGYMAFLSRRLSSPREQESSSSASH